MKFYGQQIYFGPQDKETLYYLITESSLPDDQKNRLTAKVIGEYLNDETYEKGIAAQKRNAKEYRRRQVWLKQLVRPIGTRP